MSFRKKVRNFRTEFGKSFPTIFDKHISDGDYSFNHIISETLRASLGGTGIAVKTVMAYTGAGERTVKNWFEGKNGPSGENLVRLMSHSDPILEAVLFLAERDDILAGKILVDARDELEEMIRIIDQLQNRNQKLDPPNMDE